MTDIKQVRARDITIGSYIPVGNGIVERVEYLWTDTDTNTTHLLLGAELTSLELPPNEQLRIIEN